MTKYHKFYFYIGADLLTKPQPNPNRALAMLERVASLVKPIMRKHNCEFYHVKTVNRVMARSPDLLYDSYAGT